MILSVNRANHMTDKYLMVGDKSSWNSFAIRNKRKISFPKFCVPFHAEASIALSRD